jgi:formylglycine-generating enzyme
MFAVPYVENITVAQRADGSKIVDISYDLIADGRGMCEITLKLSTDGGTSFDYIPDPANLSGDIGGSIVSGTGKAIVWNAGAEGIDFDGSQYMLQFKADDHIFPVPENFAFVQGGTIYPAQGSYTGGLTVSSFYIDKYELTNAEWNAVMGSGGGDNYPHADVSWFGAIEYCNRRSIQEDIPPCYTYNDGIDYGSDPDDWPSGWNNSDANAANVSCDWEVPGYRLPSEAEWEYAARGGLDTHGYIYSGSNDLNQVGWYSGNSYGSVHFVGCKQPNELGICDMSGNIYERCWDIDHGSYRVIRGGSYGHEEYYCSVFTRSALSPTGSYVYVGFRVCRSSPINDNFALVKGGTIYPAEGLYTGGLTVYSFYIDKYELTNAEWNAVMGSSGGDNHPRADVSWFGAIEYCNRRSMLVGLSPCYTYNDGTDYGSDPDDWPSGWNSSDANAANVSCDWNAIGYRLPSDAEWEYAARGGLDTQGCAYSGSDDLNLVGWYNMTSYGYAHPVGQLAPNELGTCDMSGNVFEWCWDVESGSNRVIRGGSYNSGLGECIVSYQTWGSPTNSLAQVGFRVCRSIPIPDNFTFVEGGTIYPAEGLYTDGLTVSDFYIDKYELTHVDWNAVMGYGGGAYYPHCQISWFEAIEYCNRRSILEGFTPCYTYNDGTDYGSDPDAWPSGWNSSDANAANVSCDWDAIGYRLLSEAEWEYAARGGLDTHGYTYSGSDDLDLVGWYNYNSGGSSHQVGQLATNELGTCDMSGNVFEWCWDVESGSNRVIRGGFFNSLAEYCTVSYRYSYGPTHICNYVGFRVCRSSP